LEQHLRSEAPANRVDVATALWQQRVANVVRIGYDSEQAWRTRTMPRLTGGRPLEELFEWPCEVGRGSLVAMVVRHLAESWRLERKR
jgi:hypothetical protein